MNNEHHLGRIIKNQRVARRLTLRQLSEMSGVSSSHLGRVERGEHFPSARILQRIAKPLGFEETELFYQADLLSTKPPVAESEPDVGKPDAYVARVLSEEPVEVQRTVIGILSVLKSIARGHSKVLAEWPEFREYAHRKYKLDEDLITMIEDLIKREERLGT